MADRAYAAGDRVVNTELRATGTVIRASLFKGWWFVRRDVPGQAGLDVVWRENAMRPVGKAVAS